MTTIAADSLPATQAQHATWRRDEQPVHKWKKLKAPQLHGTRFEPRVHNMGGFSRSVAPHLRSPFSSAPRLCSRLAAELANLYSPLHSDTRIR